MVTSLTQLIGCSAARNRSLHDVYSTAPHAYGCQLACDSCGQCLRCRARCCYRLIACDHIPKEAPGAVCTTHKSASPFPRHQQQRVANNKIIPYVLDESIQYDTTLKPAPIPDYSRLRSSEILSDCVVVVKEEQPATISNNTQANRKAKRPRGSAAQASPGLSTSTSSETIPAHKVVLWGMSKFFQAKVRLARPCDASLATLATAETLLHTIEAYLA